MKREQIEQARACLTEWARADLRVSELRSELAWARQEMQNSDAAPSQAAEAFRQLAEQIDADIAGIVRNKLHMDDLIARLPAWHGEVLRMWYKRGMNHRQIAHASHYSIDRIKHIKSASDARIAELMGLTVET